MIVTALSLTYVECIPDVEAAQLVVAVAVLAGGGVRLTRPLQQLTVKVYTAKVYFL